MKRVVKAATNPKRIPINTPPIPTIKKLAIPANMSITLIVRIWQKDLNKLYRTYEKKKAHYVSELFLISLHVIMVLCFNAELRISLSTLNSLLRYAVVYLWHITCNP